MGDRVFPGKMRVVDLSLGLVLLIEHAHLRRAPVRDYDHVFHPGRVLYLGGDGYERRRNGCLDLEDKHTASAPRASSPRFLVRE